MEKIASFQVNHDVLTPGIYLSRTDDDIITYDIRMRIPNGDSFLANAAMHTIEHLFATIARNSSFQNQIIYFGPMGCRTGFYFLVRNMEHSDAILLIREIFTQIAAFDDEIPGRTAVECGNYLEHDLQGAKEEAAHFLPILNTWSVEKLVYPA